MMNAKSFADAIGRKNIAAAVGVGPTAVSNAVGRECFPSSWFMACSQLAIAKRVPCPPSLFGFVSPYCSQNVDSDANIQVGKS